MATVRLPYTKVVKGYLYFRIQSRGKSSYIRLPDPKTPEFATEYQKQVRLREAGLKADAAQPGAGTFAALIREYRASAKYSELKSSSRANTDYALDLIEKRLGDKPVKGLLTKTVVKIQSEMKDTPGKANKYISVLSTLLGFGRLLGYCPTNVAEKIPRLKMDEHKPWPSDVIEAVLAAAKPHYALAIITGLCSGQRVSDCVLMKESMIKDGMMDLTQLKTGKDVFVPVHPTWQQAMDALPKHDTILYDRTGRPYTTEGVQAFIRRLMKDLGYVDEHGQALYTFHGLRKNSANLLAEIGATPHEISAITGMSLQMVIHYTRAVELKKVAKRIADRFRQAQIPGQVTHSKNTGNSISVDA